MHRSLIALLVVFVATSHAEPPVAVDSKQETPKAESSGVGQAQLAVWVVELDSNKYAKRESATNALAEAGPQAIPYLQQAATGKSLEAADRAVWVLKQFTKSKDPELQKTALEVLVCAERFPAVVRDAKQELADLYEEICRKQLVDLGASFSSELGGVGMVNIDGLMIAVNANGNGWRGNAEDLMMLTKLGQVSMLRVAARDIADEHVRKLADIEGLQILELIETKASVACIEELKKSHPQLRVRLKSRAMLGVGLSDMGVPTVTTVYDGKPADKAGMERGDVILKFDGNDIKSFDDLTTRISQHAPGDTVEVIIDRAGTEKKLQVTLAGTDWSKDDPLSISPSKPVPSAPKVKIQIAPR